MAGDGAGFKCVLLCLSIKMYIKNIKHNKNPKYPKLMYEVSVMCSWHFAVTNDVFSVSQKGFIWFLFDPDSLILTPGFNQSSCGESRQYSSPVCL